MKNYDTIRKLCEKNSRIAAKVVDGFLLGFAASHHGLEGKMNKQFARFRHIISKFESGSAEYMKSQFIAHRIFREDGLIGKFLNNPALKRFGEEEIDYLLKQAEQPWRFSFSVILDEPEKDFFQMQDIFSGEEFLLFSPGATELKASGSPLLWFNLIGFNGSCWQSYGPIGAYNSFRSDDIYFFATELRPGLEDDEEIVQEIEKNPLPFMMLLSGAALPRSFHKEEEILYMMAEYDMELLNTAQLRKSFKTEYNEGVYRFVPEKWEAPPHLSQAYYDENLKMILFTALTESGFRGVVDEVNAYGYGFSITPFLKVNTTMLVTTQKILQKKVVLNEYDDLFHVDPPEEEQKTVDDLNAFMALVLPDINAGRMPDIEAAAEETGVHIETARDMVEMVMEKTGRDLDREMVQEQGQIDVHGQDPDQDRGPEPGEIVDIWPEVYRKIYTLAGEIRKLAPWNWMYETELFGVKIRETGQVYFVSVMGSEGAFFALSAYKGYEGLMQFFDFQEHADTMPPETILTIPHLMLSFTGREELSGEQLASIKEAGLSFRGKGNWPQLDEIVPGYLPVLPGVSTLVDIPVILEQVIEVVRRAKKDPGCLFREGESGDAILVRTPSVFPGRVHWDDRYEMVDPEKESRKYHLTYSSGSSEKVSRLPQSRNILQIDLVLIPSPVKERGQRGYFPFALLLVEKESEMIPGMQTLAPLPDLHAMYESVPQKVLDELEKLKFRPGRIEVRSDILYQLLEKPLKLANCRLLKVKRMPQMDAATGSLLSHLA